MSNKCPKDLDSSFSIWDRLSLSCMNVEIWKSPGKQNSDNKLSLNSVASEWTTIPCCMVPHRHTIMAWKKTWRWCRHYHQSRTTPRHLTAVPSSPLICLPAYPMPTCLPACHIYCCHYHQPLPAEKWWKTFGYCITDPVIDGRNQNKMTWQIALALLWGMPKNI